MAGLEGGLDSIVGGEPVAKGFSAVSAPDDAINGYRHRPGDGDCTAAGDAGDPASGVAVEAVVEVSDLVEGGIRKLGGCGGDGSPGSEGNVDGGIGAGRGINLDLVDTGLGAVVGGEDGHSEHAGWVGFDLLDIAACAHHLASG